MVSSSVDSYCSLALSLSGVKSGVDSMHGGRGGRSSLQTPESFGDGFDRLVALRPQEIQVGMLKRLRGAPIARHDVEWEMVYSPHAPYEILQNSLIDAPTLGRLRRFARFWDLIARRAR